MTPTSLDYTVCVRAVPQQQPTMGCLTVFLKDMDDGSQMRLRMAMWRTLQNTG